MATKGSAKLDEGTRQGFLVTCKARCRDMVETMVLCSWVKVHGTIPPFCFCHPLGLPAETELCQHVGSTPCLLNLPKPR